MTLRADSGMKFDQGQINRILALVVDMSDADISILINKLREYQNKRSKKSKGSPNQDTMQA